MKRLLLSLCGLLSPWLLATPALGGLIVLDDVTPVGVTHVAGSTYIVGNRADGTAELIVASGGSIVSRTPLTGLGGNTTVTGISSNGQWISGYSMSPAADQFGLGEGVVWSSSSPSAPMGIGFISSDSFAESPALDVSSSGVAVGFGDFPPYRWDAAGGIQALDFHIIGTVGAVSDNGTVMAGSTVNPEGAVGAAVWGVDGSFTLLDVNDPSSHSAARDVSPDGNWIGGFVGMPDASVFTPQASVWHNGELILLTDAAGNPFNGYVLGITDDGFAVGVTGVAGIAFQNQVGLGFVFDPLIGHAELFEDWALREHGDVFPTTITAVNAVFSDGGNLYFALAGSGYVYDAPISSASAPVPEPSSLALCLTALVVCGGIRLVRRRHARE